MNTEDRLHAIEYQIIQSLNPETLTVEDDSADHVGHAHEGAGHFTVRIVAAVFEGKSLVERHRMVYDAVKALLDTDIHALRIHAKSLSEIA